MDKKEAFDFLKRLSDGIAIMFGPTCEALIHDMSVPNHPINYISNGHVTSRKVGSTEDVYGDVTSDEAEKVNESNPLPSILREKIIIMPLALTLILPIYTNTISCREN